jgi:hypothetical protein
MADQAELRAALAEAVEESQFLTDEEVEADSWNDWDNDAPAASDGNDPGKDEPATDEESPGTEEAQGELPNEYFGVDLTGIPEEQKAAILSALQQQDSYIHKLQAKMAAEPEPAETVAVEEPEEITDEMLLQAMGFDPEDWETQQLAPKLLPLARTVVELEERVEQLTTTETARAAESQWNSQLDELEKTYGKLPFDRIKVLKYAIDENLTSPFETYFRLAAPARKEVESTVRKVQQEAARKASQGGVRPRSSGGDRPVIDPKTTSLRDATRIAMKEAEQETGLSFKNLFGRKVPRD